MVAIKHFALALVLVALSLSLSTLNGHARPASFLVSSQRSDASSLFAQSAAGALARDFPSFDISFLLLDARTGDVLASRWDHSDAPIPMGSLLKPFTALAYGEQHNYRYPSHTCRGTSSGCWRPRGHGDVDLTVALETSCNSYFRMLTEDLSAADVTPTATRFGLESPSPDASGIELAGLGTRWRTSPLRLARAYLELVRQRQQSAARQIINGMALSARRGTGAEVHRAFPVPDVLVKTGTAACSHPRHAPGDGFAVVLVPAANPQFLLLVRVHGIPGSQAAKTAGQMLRRIEE